jgi:putative DNA primase/helicase
MKLLPINQTGTIIHHTQERKVDGEDIYNAREMVVGSPHYQNDVGYADAFATRYLGKVKFIAEEGVWIVFDDVTGWHRDTKNEVLGLFTEYSREIYLDALQDAQTNPDREAATRRLSQVARLGNSSRITPALEFAKANPRLAIGATDIDQEPYFLGTLNGVVDLRDGSFQAHAPDVLVTRKCSCAFDPVAECPTFMRFLAEVQPDQSMREYLKRLMGYTLTGYLDEHALPFHHGFGANGKSTFLEQTLFILMGSYACKVTDNFVYTNSRGASPDLEIASLCGIRFALGEENDSGGSLNERLLKSATGGDRLKGRHLYRSFMEYTPTAKIHLVGNHRPRISGCDDGIWRRFKLIEWGVTIPEVSRDPKLARKLQREYPGILNWLIEGAIEQQQSGTQPPLAVNVATGKFREDSDTFGDFLREKTSDSETGEISKGDLFELYKEYCEDQNIQPRFRLSKRVFGNRIADRGYNEGKAHMGIRVWRGLKRKSLQMH